MLLILLVLFETGVGALSEHADSTISKVLAIRDMVFILQILLQTKFRKRKIQIRF